MVELIKAIGEADAETRGWVFAFTSLVAVSGWLMLATFCYCIRDTLSLFSPYCNDDEDDEDDDEDES